MRLGGPIGPEPQVLPRAIGDARPPGGTLLANRRGWDHRTIEPKRERTLYEIASSFFAVVVILFAIAGMLVAGLGEDGPASGAFAICAAFLALGLGRLYLGLRRGNEGAALEPDSDQGSQEAQMKQEPSQKATPAPEHSRSRGRASIGRRRRRPRR